MEFIYWKTFRKQWVSIWVSVIDTVVIWIWLLQSKERLAYSSKSRHQKMRRLVRASSLLPRWYYLAWSSCVEDQMWRMRASFLWPPLWGHTSHLWSEASMSWSLFKGLSFNVNIVGMRFNLWTRTCSFHGSDYRNHYKPGIWGKL